MVKPRGGQITVDPVGTGDAMTFRGDVPHGPERLLELPIAFLSVIMYGGDTPA
mgnify:CR=1 FL=1